MNPMLKQYTPALAEASREEMSAILTRKAEEVGPAGLADYVGFTIETIEDKIERLKAAKADILMLEKATKGKKLIILSEVANLLIANDVEKLEGDRISSITIASPSPKKKLVIKDKEALISNGYTKISIDEIAVKKAIEAGEIDEDIATLEIEHQEQIAKVNRRKQI